MDLNQLLEVQSKYDHLGIIPIFDEILDGGIQTGILTEIYGEAGSGKTHICMALMINTVISFKSNKVIYISTAKPLQQDRFAQLLQYRSGKKSKDKFTSLYGNCIIQHLNNIKFIDEYIYEQLPKLLEQYQFKLIIIDNIATYLQELQLSLNNEQKVALLKKFSTHFRKLAKKHNIAVVFVNNVVASAMKNKLYASLGVRWPEMIDERIVIEKKGQIRQFKVELSHRVPQDSTGFTIQESGVFPQLD